MRYDNFDSGIVLPSLIQCFSSRSHTQFHYSDKYKSGSNLKGRYQKFSKLAQSTLDVEVTMAGK